MPSVSKAQARFMQAAANNKDFAKQAGIPQKVAKEYVAEDRKMGNAKYKGKKK